ncbi:MAG: hypothetical protein N4A38_05060 [Candidatus Gracilibacteria bacterium]|nr:hypothetical protein [Candidatus Gracilibacteria bacterium]
MGYKQRARSRKLRAKILAFINIFRFKFFVASLEGKLVLIGAFISIISLFFPWINSAGGEEIIMANAFSVKIGYIGFIIFILNFIMIFLMLSQKRKEKIKLNLSLSFRDHFVVNTFSIFSLLLCFVAGAFTRGLLSFSQNIIIGQGVIFCLVGTVFSLWGGMLLYKQYKKDYESFIVDNTSEVGEHLTDERNMQLPF